MLRNLATAIAIASLLVSNVAFAISTDHQYLLTNRVGKQVVNYGVDLGALLQAATVGSTSQAISASQVTLANGAVISNPDANTALLTENVFKHAYDSSAHWSATQGDADAGVTLNSVVDSGDASGKFTISDSVIVNDTLEVNGDITLENDEYISNASDGVVEVRSAQVKQSFDAASYFTMSVPDTTGIVTLNAVADAGDASGGFTFSDAMIINDTLEVNGDITLQNDETISNSSNGVVAITSPSLHVKYDGSNYLDADVSATGAVDLDAVGSGSAFSIKDPTDVVGKLSLNNTARVAGEYYSFMDISDGGVGYFAGTADDKTYLYNAEARRVIANEQTGDSRDVLFKGVYRNYAANDASSNAHGLGVSVRNESGGVLGTVKGLEVGTSTKSGATSGSQYGIEVTAEDYGTVSDNLVGVKVDLRNEGALPTTEVGILVHNSDNSTANAAHAAIKVSDTGTNTGFDYGLDLNGASVVSAEFRGSNGETIDNISNGVLNFTSPISRFVQDSLAYLQVRVDDAGDATLDLVTDGVGKSVIIEDQLKFHADLANRVSFYDDFLGEDLNVTDSFWSVDKGTNNNGTEGIVADGIAGEYALTLVVNDEAQDLSLTSNDQLNWDIEKNPIIEFRAKVANGGTAGGTVVMGLAGAYDNDPDTVAQNIWFKVDDIATSLAVVCESEDGATTAADKASGVTLTTGEYKKFRIDASDQADAKFYIDDVEVCDFAFDTSNYAGNLQPYFHLNKASGAAVDVVTVDYVKIYADR